MRVIHPGQARPEGPSVILAPLLSNTLARPCGPPRSGPGLSCGHTGRTKNPAFLDRVIRAPKGRVLAQYIVIRN